MEDEPLQILVGVDHGADVGNRVQIRRDHAQDPAWISVVARMRPHDRERLFRRRGSDRGPGDLDRQAYPVAHLDVAGGRDPTLVPGFTVAFVASELRHEGRRLAPGRVGLGLGGARRQQRWDEDRGDSSHQL
ncbi:hypothetical protein [Candidatus Palauibacter sp.]|uniref:hypothetical protein n=1 Tax=Candidatus Palauibacter sp. TaxID=3101350 RepID=UPI003B5A6A85